MLSKKVDENLELRFVSERYAEEVTSTVQRNFDYLSEWMPWVTENYSVESARDFIKINRQKYFENEISDYFIFENKQIVGVIGFHKPDFANKSIEIGYWLDKRATGRGIITKCCRPIIDFIFNELNFKRIVIRCATENIKSQAIPERLGFTREGIARQAEYLNERFVDLVVFSILNEEWKNIDH
jgi:ribosomal-protein-serine acetyltransferase